MAAITDGLVQLRVGEEVFHTTKGTLAESRLLAAMFSIPQATEGEYFVDADPKMFEHILRYLRTRTYPLFYDNVKGHDHCLYALLAREAEFYQIDKLAAWLSARKYLQVVTKRMKHYAHEFIGDGQMRNMHAYWKAEEDLTVMSFKTGSKKAWKCPSGIWEHDGFSTACVKARCFRSANHNSDWKIQNTVEVVGFMTTFEIRHDLLRSPPADEAAPSEMAQENPPPYVEGDDGSTTTEASHHLAIRPIQTNTSSSSQGGAD